MKKIDLPSKIRILSLMILPVIMVFSCVAYNRHCTYKSIKVEAIENATIEYGSANYSVNDLVKKVDGDVISVKNNIDTSVVGTQEVILKVKKDDIVKDRPIKVSVVDTVYKSEITSPSFNLVGSLVPKNAFLLKRFK